MNIESKSCTVELTKEEIRSLRLFADLYLQTSSDEIKTKIPNFWYAVDMDNATKFANAVKANL